MPDSQSLGLLIAATLAGIICFRLYWVLGRRTGHEPPPQPQAKPSPLSAPPPQPVAVEAPQTQDAAPVSAPVSANGLLDIQLADRNFDTAKFLGGAREAYKMILDAFTRGDHEALRPLLAPEVMDAFGEAIKTRTAPPDPLLRLINAKIVDARLDGRQAEITVAFNAEFSHGAITDVWTFARSVDASDPNWHLITTAGDMPG
ncbi:MAG TPA: Tim44/TimA family putative adaptor protein [Rhizomicrobium sp.]|nr:Tim44/TimA family putative adaptor protein [Rhizomicrobium sp.]